jgi:GTP cyclohydrolase II
MKSTVTVQPNPSLAEASIRNQVRIPLQKKEALFVSFSGLVDGLEHIALDFRKNKDEVPLVRIHSECLTGDVFHSTRCDCGEQLQEAIDTFASKGGVLLYLRQEGRGIGLYNKLDAYELQLKGHDTYEANRMLGLGDDLRDFAVAAQMLSAMKIGRIRLLSNNPEKVSQIRNYGIEVAERVSTGVFSKEHNLSYLLAKIRHTGHRIKLSPLLTEKKKT